MADNPIHLPLIVAAPTFTADNSALTGGGVPQTITMQLTTSQVCEARATYGVPQAQVVEVAPRHGITT